jgi:hypothetical protein
VATLSGCYRPLIFTNAAIYPTATSATRNDFNWSYALFNQFASNLSYEFRLDYSILSTSYLSNAIRMIIGGTTYTYSTWASVGSSSALSGTLDATWSQRLSTILFNRDFDASNKALNTDRLSLRKVSIAGDSDVNLTITIKSRVNYSVNVGTILIASQLVSTTGLDNFGVRTIFYNDSTVLQDAILYTATTMATDTRKWDLGTILTGVNNFDLIVSMTDIPPTATGTIEMTIFEYNLFALTELVVEEGETNDLWGWEYEVVEWYNILGHFKNLGWWLINQSPISPIFIWIDTYIISWITAFFNILEDIFL